MSRFKSFDLFIAIYMKREIDCIFIIYHGTHNLKVLKYKYIKDKVE